MIFDGNGNPEYVRAAGEGEWRVQVWVQPGAKRDELAGMHQDCLKIRLNAPAVDNKANASLVEYVAALLGLKRSQVALASGQTSRKKTLRVRAEKEPIWPRVRADQAAGNLQLKEPHMEAQDRALSKSLKPRIPNCAPFGCSTRIMKR